MIDRWPRAGREGTVVRRSPRCVAAILLGGVLGSLLGCDRSTSPDRIDRSGPRPTVERARGAEDPGPASGLFADVTARAGLERQVARPIRPDDYFMPDSMGPGIALLDFDGDHDLDLFRIGAVRARDGNLESDAGVDRLYENDGRGRFQDVTLESGLGDRGYGMGAAVGDIDGDGDPDLYLSRLGTDRLYRNDGGRFVDVSEASDPLGPGWSASAGFFDADDDGDLDLYVTRYLEYDPAVRGSDAAGRPEYPAPSMFPGLPDRLYRNRGDGTFEDITDRSGIGAQRGRGLGVLFLDLDEDGRLDIVVANDGEPNFAWIATGDGRYVDRGSEWGLAVNAEGRAEAGMGLDAGDIDHDGDLDLVMTHLVRETHTLYRREGPTHVDVTVPAGLAGPSFPRTGFGVGFLDVDLDGALDLVAIHGRVLRGSRDPRTPLGSHWAPYAEEDALFLGDGAGRFREARERAGDLAVPVEVGRGLAWGDLDRDGALDLVVTTADGSLRCLRGTAIDGERRGHWLRVRTIEPRRGSDAVGASVRVLVEGRWLTRLTGSARSYLSSVDPGAHFGLGTAASFEKIEVTWPNGAEEAFPGGAGDRTIRVVRGEGE